MKKYFLLLIILSVSVLAKSPLKITGNDHQIIYSAFNHEFDKAINLAEEKIAENPNLPKYYFLNIVTLSLKHLADSDTIGFEKRYEFRTRMNEELIEYTEGVLEKFENIEMTPENKFYLANIYGYLGRMHGFTGSYMSAFSNAKKGKDYLEELVEKYPDLYDAYLLLGMFEYYADRLGGITEFIAAVLGFSGDRDTGIEYLKLAHLKGELTRPFAEFILGETYAIQESNNFDAVGYFSLLVQKYPNNKNFYEWYTRILLQLDRLKEAEAMIINDSRNHLDKYIKGSFYIKNGDYQKAVKVFEEAIESKNFKWRGAYEYSKYLRALSELLAGNANAAFEKELTEERSKIYNEIKKNLSTAKQVFRFAADVGRLDVGVEMEIPQIVNLPQNGFLRSMYEFYNGVYFHRYRDATRANLFFNNVAANREYFREESVEYLINIYKFTNPTEQQLDQLEDIVDDLDDEDLEFSFMDLRE